MHETKSISITRLITVPVMITLGVTILRLVGELAHWPTPWFSPVAGGGAAVVGISWLPIIFGPFFALKLAGVGNTPASWGKAIGFALLALVVFALGSVLFGVTIGHPSIVTLGALVLMLGAAFVPGLGWRSLGHVLLAYAFAARLPVLIVMYFAMRANGGAGWGTHYDAVPPALAHLALATRFVYAGFLPQMTLWIGWTVGVGAAFGATVAAITRRGKQTAQAGA